MPGFDPVSGHFLPRSETNSGGMPHANPSSLKDFLNALLILSGRLRRFCVVSATGIREGQGKGVDLVSWSLRTPPGFVFSTPEARAVDRPTS
ncbi:hypothetical protein EMEDMD4_90119 [Sinorhizobium medicae]|uniref:Uncharacterized protein n=1 Tax=Sinorhizobium medicae TaxID=110321 RepID=A0A508XBM8_9HYPH|nr:hypothetical protein EMEDMD4_90119 [Sinorhizobium medicae]